MAGNDLVLQMSVNGMKFYLGVSSLGFMVSILGWLMLITIAVSLNDGNIWILVVGSSESHYLQYSLNLACILQHRLPCKCCAVTSGKQLPPFQSIMVPSSSDSSIPSRVDCLTLMMKALGSFKHWFLCTSRHGLYVQVVLNLQIHCCTNLSCCMDYCA